MSSAGLGATTTLLGGSPSGQAASHVNNQTQFTLVLGGGGMKGVAHVGVLQALTERGFVPAQVVGSSVGALVGAAWSAGKSIAELRAIAVNLQRKDIFAGAHADMAFKRMRSPALFRREPLDHLLDRLVGNITFQELRNPLIVNTVDLNSGLQVFWGLEGLDEIPVRDAVFASCALPGYLPPREIRGRFYMDGATVDNLPVGTARAWCRRRPACSSSMRRGKPSSRGPTRSGRRSTANSSGTAPRTPSARGRWLHPRPRTRRASRDLGHRSGGVIRMLSSSTTIPA